VKTHSTAFQPTKEKLKTLFATHGTPRQLQSDMRPPFNSRELAEFATTEGFHHHQVTQQHACANGKAESSTKLNIANAFIQDNTSKERDAEKNQPCRIGEKFCSMPTLSVQEEIITNTEETAKTCSSDKME